MSSVTLFSSLFKCIEFDCLESNYLNSQSLVSEWNTQLTQSTDWIYFLQFLVLYFFYLASFHLFPCSFSFFFFRKLLFHHVACHWLIFFNVLFRLSFFKFFLCFSPFFLSFVCLPRSFFSLFIILLFWSFFLAHWAGAVKTLTASLSRSKTLSTMNFLLRKQNHLIVRL